MKRLLDSIVQQSFRDFEVIITDDSPDAGVKNLISNYVGLLPGLQYLKNEPAEGMPENWNAVISKAAGVWVKIMHDDDWFLTEDALAKFAEKTSTDADFIFSNYENNYMDAHGNIVDTRQMVFPQNKLDAISKEPLLLLADNIIGPPSVCMVRASNGVFYDNRLRWRVDIDYYKSVLSLRPVMELIADKLIGVGMNENQVTNRTKNRPEVELPEAFILLQKYGTAPLKNWIIYDSWWRMFRNMHITSYKHLQQFVPEDWPVVIFEMLNFMERTPRSFLKTGVSSKLCMFLSFLANRHRIQ